MAGDLVTLFLAGDVMLGRGVDQVLASPGDPTLHESYAHDARDYVALAEAANGPVPRPVEPEYVWGDALALLDAASPAARVVNVETAITVSDDFAAKGVTYRMHPANVAALAAVRPDVCVLANNHVLDFGTAGLVETLTTLAGAGLAWAGAGHDLAEAAGAAVVPLGGRRRLLVLAVGTASSGIPPSWAAAPDRPGVAFLPEPSPEAADVVLERIAEVRRTGDVVVASVHWGGNWGYEVALDERVFAHRLVEGGVDVVHGHSSHHPRPVEVYRDRLVLYGCGDLVDDYEGIAGHEGFRDDLRLLHLVTVDGSGRLVNLRLLPLHARRLRLERASAADTRWLAGTLDRVSRPFAVRLAPERDGAVVLRRA